jgi:hypothetical protein
MKCRLINQITTTHCSTYQTQSLLFNQTTAILCQRISGLLQEEQAINSKYSNIINIAWMLGDPVQSNTACSLERNQRERKHKIRDLPLMHADKELKQSSSQQHDPALSHNPSSYISNFLLEPVFSFHQIPNGKENEMFSTLLL